MKRTLADLAAVRDRRPVRVVEVTGSGAESARLREIGFCAGATVRFVRRAPLGDPAMYEVRGAVLSLRRGEAGRIRVRQAATS